MNEIDKKLAEWAGFRPTTIEDMWAFPKGVQIAATHSSCKFTESIRDCFEWLVPQLNKLGYDYLVEGWQAEYSPKEHRVVIYVRTGHHMRQVSEAIDISPSLAFCRAIERLA